jgi:hypothetical protein
MIFLASQVFAPDMSAIPMLVCGAIVVIGVLVAVWKW